MMKKIVFFVCLIVFASLSAEVKVLAFAGSARKDSYNKQLVNEAAALARSMGATVTVVDLKEYPMPFYDEELETSAGLPKNAKRFRDLMIANDAIIIASPEYNSSIPALLKNTLDWASRGESKGWSDAAFKGKRFAIMSASPGKGGGKRALVHLRSVIEAAGGTVISKQVSIPNAHQYFAEKKKIENSALKEEIAELLQKP